MKGIGCATPTSPAFRISPARPRDQPRHRHDRGSRRASTPLGTLDLSGWSLSGHLAASTGRVGYQNQIKALVDPSTIVPPPHGVSWSYPLFDMAPPEESAMAAYLRTRAEAYGQARGDGGHNTSRVNDCCSRGAGASGSAISPRRCCRPRPRPSRPTSPHRSRSPWICSRRGVADRDPRLRDQLGQPTTNVRTNDYFDDLSTSSTCSPSLLEEKECSTTPSCVSCRR